MSFYSSSISTRLIDPIFNQSNTRCEFRLPTETVLLSNMRLLNVGAKSGLLATAKYNHLVGAPGVMKAIRLLDGNQVLDQINDVNRWMAFKNYTKNNTVCSNLNNTLSQNALGYVYTDPNITKVDASGEYLPESDFSQITPFKGSGNVRHLEEETTSAWLSLRDLFPMLSSVVNVNTAVFKNLRVVIEWTKTHQEYAVDVSGVTLFETLQPLLCVDELTADTPMKREIMGKFDPISFSTIEQDRVRVNALAGEEVKSSTFQILGFNNKKVERVCVQKVRPTGSVNGSLLFGTMGSPSMLDETHQWRINGSNLYSQPISQYNEALALTNDVWGVCDQPLGGCPFTGNYIPVGTVATLIGLHYPDAKSLMGETSYISGNFHGERIRELQLTYGRRGITGADTKYNEAITLLIYAEVQRVIVPSKTGGYIVSYL